MIRQNLHTHSIYDDGKDTIEQMVQTAKEKGFTVLGFSGHGHNPEDDGSMSLEDTKRYCHEIREAAKREAENGLKIFCGIEEDSISPVDPKDWDYVIGSVHYLQKDGRFWPVDYSKDRFDAMISQGWNGDIHAMLQDYWKALEAQADNPVMDIVGHVDLITKYNENEDYFSFENPEYLAMAESAIEKLVKAGKIFEMNTGAIARGYRSEPYPHPLLLKMIQEKGGKLMINTDCHNRENLDLGLGHCLQLAKKAGFESLMMLTENGFEERSIEEFEPEKETAG